VSVAQVALGGLSALAASGAVTCEGLFGPQVV